MEIKQKLEILADAAKYDASCSSSGSSRKRQSGGMGNTEGMGICHSYTPDGRCISLLKILLTNYCIYDCKFCINRQSSDTPRARFTPKEVVWLTLQFYRRNYIEGLFLSSGIVESVDFTMEQIIEVARSLREDHSFGGYIHLKVVPGASDELIELAGRWADRVSANIELPKQADLDQLAPAKKLPVVFETMTSIREKKAESDESKTSNFRTPSRKKLILPFAPAGQTTQMIVGATPTADREILSQSSSLYKAYGLRRVYYSAYSPIPNADATLPVSRPSLIRENRLYQADWLLRFYGFSADEVATVNEPNLPLDIDPKTAWALRNRAFFPIDINVAPREALLRIPGLGVRTVDRILKIRRLHKLTMGDLGRMNVPLKRAKYFVITADYNPDAYRIDRQNLSQFLRPQAEQLSLFENLGAPPAEDSPSHLSVGDPDKVETLPSLKKILDKESASLLLEPFQLARTGEM